MVLAAGQDKNKIMREEDSVKRFAQSSMSTGRIGPITQAVEFRTHERDARAYT
jgi:hypothetical protein